MLCRLKLHPRPDFIHCIRYVLLHRHAGNVDFAAAIKFLHQIKFDKHFVPVPHISGGSKGRINIGINRLKQLFPDKQIVLLTPLHRSLANFGETNVQPDENYQNSCGEYVDAYVQAVKEAGNVWGVPVIDFNAVTGLNPMVEEQLIYFYDAGYDRLHPSTKGQIRMARTLMYQLFALPATF